ncbi:PLP-dependent aminotransferase family protein [Chryseobacterium sp. SNU WT5]|uniref:aminotransferase-like domain-containing protein n=1 Tax=Chryseobacterium sp. SNU WT5 TaxID=2594269 RepID=UPI001180F1C2|nr:PLP-dependent aminotransferase family protein [Chryseobacterium sp. SNU WT5]QDP86282.1 PLP-dependent aminotransferase family protein [Chryseobacterium sp. SNU WT5]
MNSPVILPFQSFIKIDRRKKDAVYLQIVYQFINAVKSNLLEDGDQLPGSRIIAESLHVHRKTMVAALGELKDQGWLETVPNVGSFVKNPEISTSQVHENRTFLHPPEKAPFLFRKEFILDAPFERNQEKIYFTEGTPDYRIIRSEELVRFYTSVIRRKKQSGILTATSDGSLFFKDQLSYYLNLTRGFHVSRDFLFPVAGIEKAHSILSRLLVNKGDVILVEELSYYLPNMIYSQAGAHLKTIPVDEDGMDVDYIQNNFKPGEIRMVYINVKCQYPTTIGLSENRKKQLLILAEQYNFIVIEDDSDFEFSATKNKKETLLRRNGGNRIIYIGTFGRFLNPGFQMNFIIAPKDLLEEAAKYLNIFGKPDVMMEKALGELIHQGDIHRYQRKSTKVIAERKEVFIELLNTYFVNKLSFTIPVAGLAFWIQFKNSISLTDLQKKARKKGLSIPMTCLYQNRKVSALRLGFAHLNPAEMEEAIRLLSESYFEVIGGQLT